MTVIERKNKIKNIIDKLSNEKLEEAFYFLQELSKKDKNRVSIVNNLLKDERWLFEELAK